MNDPQTGYVDGPRCVWCGDEVTVMGDVCAECRDIEAQEAAADAAAPPAYCNDCGYADCACVSYDREDDYGF